MKKNILIGILLIILASVVLEVPEIVLSSWDEMRKDTSEKTVVQDLDGIQTVVDNLIDNPVKIGESMDVLSITDKFDSWNLLEEDWKWFFIKDGIKRQLIYNGHDIELASISPYHKKLGFFFKSENHSLGKTILAVLDLDKKTFKEVYNGDTWTSNWEWKDDEAVVVRRSCGTECMMAYVIEIDTGRQLEKYRVY